MDTASIYELFRATLDPAQQVRKDAEVHLKALETSPTLFTQLLEILNANDPDTSVKQAASIYFKNRVRTGWDPSTHSKTVAIAEGDKRAIREAIIPLMVRSPPAVRVQLVNCLTPMLHADFPANWPTYLPQTRDCLQASDLPTVHTGLLTLLAAVRFYQWKTGDQERAPLEEIITVCFPIVCDLGDRLVALPGDEAAAMLKVVLRCFHAAIMVELSPLLQQDAVLSTWLALFVRTIQRPSELGADAELEEAAGDEGMKARKWAMRCVNRLFAKYGNPALLPEAQSVYRPFAEHFVTHYAPELVRAYFSQVEAFVARATRFSPKCLFLTSGFFSDAIKHRTPWKLIKPHTETLVQHYVFPQLMYTPEEEELWEDNPLDFVHKRSDPMGDFDSPTMAATNLLHDLATDRRKHSFMLIMNFINQVVLEYASADSTARDPRRKDGALHMLAALAKVVLHAKSPVRGNMEQFVVTHVFPEFTSPNRFLRLRALAFYSDFGSLPFKNPQCLPFILERTLALLGDPEVPVRVQAAVAFQSLVHHEELHDRIIPHLPQIMQSFLALTHDLDVDTLAGVMEEVVETFSDHMAPYAVELCGQLSQTYARLMQDSTRAALGDPDSTEEFDYDALGDKTFAAMGILRTISTLILNLESTPQIVTQLEQHLVPLAAFTFQHELIDVYDDVFEILDCLTFYTKQISPAMWSLLPVIRSSFDGSGLDYFEVMLPTLDNFVSYGAREVVANPAILDCMLHFVYTGLRNERMGQSDRVSACKLAESLMLHCRGQLDAQVPDLVVQAGQLLQATGAITSRTLLVYCLELVLNALYYNPRLTLGALEAHQLTTPYFTRLTSSTDRFQRVHDKKLLILALCAVISLPATDLPTTVQAGLPTLFDTLLRAFETLPRAQAHRHQMVKEYAEDMGDSDDDSLFGGRDEGDFDGEDDEEADVDAEDKAYLDHLAREAKKLSKSNVIASGADGDDDDHVDGVVEDLTPHLGDEIDDDDDEDLDEEVLFESPLDQLNVYNEFRTVFNGLKAAGAPTFEGMTAGLTADKQNFVMQVLSTSGVDTDDTDSATAA
ncbi:Nonsense-mediated mRNA decay protein 5 [Tieghemiomyces parasiticus]|uniref:Nonsense-mediated mRNA decay protein 5 n=1 Tax=Tieghemiomyces parasiticus TaxID=78921 RepID=A0A9W8DWG9_9FUNG|nr:Nonsense-mediated mRNA decay protein 5 [Tieghemiomyces parasiticus]